MWNQICVKGTISNKKLLMMKRNYVLKYRPERVNLSLIFQVQTSISLLFHFDFADLELY